MTSDPYVGPRPFRRGEASVFFGRAREAELVRSVWISERVTVLHGHAAVGKTSLLNAGVLPLLAADPASRVLPVGRLVHQAAWPPARTSATDGDHRFTLLSSWTGTGDRATTIAGALAATVDGEPVRILGAIDHVEEVFTVFPPRTQERDLLMAELAEALRALPLNLLLVVRDDHLAAVSAYEGRLSTAPFAYLRLDDLDRESAVAAVARPLEGTGRRFAPSVAERLVDRLRTVTYRDRLGESETTVSNRVAPLDLQITCAELWSSLSAGDEVIGADQVDELGDPDRALAAYTDRAIRDVARETGRPERALRAWLEATFVTAHGTRGLAYRGIARTADEPNSVVDALVDRHILTGEQRAGSTWYQLAQNRLVEAVRSSNRERQITVAQLSPAPTRTPADFQAAAEAALGEGDLVSARRFAQVAARRSQEQGDERRIAQLLAFQGQVARVEGDLEAARESLVAARTEFESQQNTRAVTRVLTVLAEVCLSMDNVWEAVDLGRQAVARSPGDIEARTVLGYAMWRAGSPADAEAHFNDALDLDRNAARAAAGRGRVRVELRDYLRALADLDHALELGLPADEEPAARSARQRALDLSA